MTPTGRASGGELIGKYGSRLIQAYLPYDLPGSCASFFDHFKPQLGLLMETELWPNLIAGAKIRNIPVRMINARPIRTLAARFSALSGSFTLLLKPCAPLLHKPQRMRDG